MHKLPPTRDRPLSCKAPCGLLARRRAHRAATLVSDVEVADFAWKRIKTRKWTLSLAARQMRGNRHTASGGGGKKVDEKRRCPRKIDEADFREGVAARSGSTGWKVLTEEDWSGLFRRLPHTTDKGENRCAYFDSENAGKSREITRECSLLTVRMNSSCCALL